MELQRIDSCGIRTQELQSEFDERKHQYDTLSLQLESSMSRLEQEVKKYQVRNKMTADQCIFTAHVKVRAKM
jgi:septation ring formation regulator EzrA